GAGIDRERGLLATASGPACGTEVVSCTTTFKGSDMTTIRTLLFALLAGLGAVTLAGCATSETGRATGQVVDDASITARVKAALAREAGVGRSLDVNVTTYGGTVQLSGFAENQEMAERAGQVARTVDGVKAV